jgi:cobalt/nickel transport system ATP-binding protein
MVLINLEDILFSYPGRQPILNTLSFQFHEGDKVGLIGPNGSGKTTLFHVIMGLLKPASGKMEIFGNQVMEEKDFHLIRQKIGLLFQDADDQLFSPTVLEDVTFGPLNLGKPKNEAIDTAKETLKILGLEGFEDRITYKLSGGEKKLVSLATVLAMEPEILLLAEPTSGLDDATKSSLTAALSNLELSYIVISHEFDFLSETTSAIYSMKEGTIQLDKELHLHRHAHLHPYGDHPHEHKESEL